jgi:mono/diheme cytochrome c family protein
VLFAVLGLIGLWFLSAPRPLTEAALPHHTSDAVNGERLFHAAGCFSCHKPASSLKGVDGLPAGGSPLKTPIGTLYPPNLTPDPETGIAKWSDLEFVNAVQRGIGKNGGHLIPAFPYTSYAAMRTEDVLDIRAYLTTLPPVVSPPRRAEIPAAFLLRRGIGLWKWFGLDTGQWRPNPSQSESWNRGAYLVNAPGHCGECHTPRNLLMVRDQSRKFAGGPHPEGTGKVPSLRDLAGRGRFTDVNDLAQALQFGETLGYDKLSSGGMGAVQQNLSKLPPEDIAAIAEYLMNLK